VRGRRELGYNQDLKKLTEKSILGPKEPEAIRAEIEQELEME